MRLSYSVALLAIFLIQASLCFDVGMRLLLVVPTDDTATGNLAQLALDARGIPYDVVSVPMSKMLDHVHNQLAHSKICSNALHPVGWQQQPKVLWYYIQRSIFG